MEQKIEKRLFQNIPVEAIVLTGSPNMRYIAGFTGEGYVYISRQRKVIVTDSRYVIAAKKESPDYEVVNWREVGYYDMLVTLLKKDAVLSLGFEDSRMTVNGYNSLQTALKKESMLSVTLCPIKDRIDKLRAVKTKEEQEKIRKAEAIGDYAFSKMLPLLKIGMTEKQVAAYLEFFMKEKGAEGLSFDTIAASGIHSAMPHATPTDKTLQEGDFLTMDFGCLYKGYCSDMTRTVVIGTASDRQRDLYSIVQEAQKKALEGVCARKKGAQVDALARNVIEKAGYGNCFGHSLGHSVGIEIHESPNFSPKEETILQPGMVITVEPGIYVENFGGVRIEDVVIVTEDGCENITGSSKELIEIKNA